MIHVCGPFLQYAGVSSVRLDVKGLALCLDIHSINSFCFYMCGWLAGFLFGYLTLIQDVPDVQNQTNNLPIRLLS